MASTGEVFPTSGTSTSESPWSDNNWSNPAQVISNNSTYASVTASTFDNGDQTWVLKAFGFDFSAVPAGSTIDGVTARIESRADTTSVGIDLVQLLNVSRAKVGTNQSDTSHRLTTSDTVYTFGGSSDLWGNALTVAWVQDADFGVAIGGHAYTANSQIFVDYVTLEITYTPPVTPNEGTTSGTVVWTGAVVGVTVHSGSTIGSVTWAGTVTGTTTRVGEPSGSSTWAGLATGATIHAGSATGVSEWAGATTGTTTHEGSTTGTATWTGSAQGEAPAVGAQEGAAAGTTTWMGSASGSASCEGVTGGSFDWVGVVTGSSFVPPVPRLRLEAHGFSYGWEGR